MIELRLEKDKNSDDDAFLKRFAEDGDYDRLLGTTTKVVRKDGSILCILLKNAITLGAGGAMYRAVRDKIAYSMNRGTAGGGTRGKFQKKDGTISNTNVAPPVQSSIIGFFDRNPRFPYCRKTAFNDQHPEAYANCQPALREASALFAKHAPDHFGRQQAIVSQTHKDFVIPGTVFTTVTLNKNFRTAYHRDAGDYADGFGVMSYYRGGRFNGGHLVFPAYRVALKLDSLDLVLFDAHEVHGNTEIKPLRDGWERITCVHYYRENMVHCGSAGDELELARSHDGRDGSRDLRAKA